MHPFRLRKPPIRTGLVGQGVRACTVLPLPPARRYDHRRRSHVRGQGLPEEIARGVHNEIVRGAGSAVVVIATDNRDGHFLDLAHHEFRRTGNLVRNGEHRDTQVVPVWVCLPAIIAQRRHPRNADGDVHDTIAPCAPECQAAIAQYQQLAADQAKKKDELKSQAEQDQKDYDAANFHDDQFDLADALLAIAISLLAVTALTHLWWLYWLALVPTGFGVMMGLAGLLSWGIHPQALIRLLS